MILSPARGSLYAECLFTCYLRDQGSLLGQREKWEVSQSLSRGQVGNNVRGLFLPSVGLVEWAASVLLGPFNGCHLLETQSWDNPVVPPTSP